MNKKKLHRVDIQVSILAASIVIISCSLIFLLNYAFSYRDMMSNLIMRVNKLYSYLDSKLEEDAFTQINGIEDEQTEIYLQTKELLENTKRAAGVRYLYTAKKIKDGSFIYLVDGLDSNSSDFRHSGDLIETEIIKDMQRAVNGEIVLPDRIKETSWGYIFISYFPIHSNGNIIGVLGIEFDAEHQYLTYKLLKLSTPVVILIFCVIAVIISVTLFKRISNPTFHDLATTDFLTGLKNRNAFETDIHNLNQNSKRGKINCGFLSMDLDNLKQVNDTYGHEAGDEYIKNGCKIMRTLLKDSDVLYRIGGDEFVIALSNCTEKELEDRKKQLEEEINAQKDSEIKISISCGYAKFNPEKEEDLYSTLKKADQVMYEQKKDRKKHSDE